MHSPEKAGRDVGELCGLGPTGVVATDDEARVLALDADCVLYSPLLPDTSQVVRILESGKNVVTPLGWFYPFASGDVTALETACRQARVTLHGTGIHPGGITERFPLMLSALSSRIRHVRAEEFSDIRTYRAEFVVREIMLFGKTPEEARESPMLELLGQRLRPVDRHGRRGARRRARSGEGDHARDGGRDRADRFAGRAHRPRHRGGAALHLAGNGRRRARSSPPRVNWLMGQEHLDPPWSFGRAGERFEVEVDGEPSVRVAVHGLHPPRSDADLERNPGIVATAMHCVNAIPYVCRADPGIRTYLDLPLVSGRHEGASRLGGRS